MYEYSLPHGGYPDITPISNIGHLPETKDKILLYNLNQNTFDLNINIGEDVFYWPRL